MTLTDRLTRVLLSTMTIGAVLLPATVAAAQPAPGPGDLTTPTTDPCEDLGTCEPDPDPECPPFVATCDDITDDPCDPVEDDCSDEPCPQDGDCPEPCPEDALCPAPDPDPHPEPEPDPDPESYDPSVPARPTFTG